MKSSSGAYFIALDHIRAVAVFFVFAWHFVHVTIPFEYTPALFPFALLDEGHTGVALFMTLSGYLFAKLLEGKSIDYLAFLRNRALRLLPLLCAVVLIVGIEKLINGESLLAYARTVARGALLPTLPNGGWSITVECHFYVILPLLLWLTRKSKLLPLVIILAALAVRSWLFMRRGEIQIFAYWTILGRLDQFVLGMLLCQFRAWFARRHLLVVAVFAGFALFYWHFDYQGGFWQNPVYPSPSPWWIIQPTIEGLAYAIGIAWYETSFTPSTTGVSWFIGRIGEFSYSIYLLYDFFVVPLALFIHRHVSALNNFYWACGWALIAFLPTVLVGYLSFRFLEAPFLKLRKRYTAVPPA